MDWYFSRFDSVGPRGVWIGEGFGGLFAGSADPLTGAPGAAILYVFLAVLVWPSAAPRSGRSVAVTRWLGPVASRVGWVGLWGQRRVPRPAACQPHRH